MFIFFDIVFDVLTSKLEEFFEEDRLLILLLYDTVVKRMGFLLDCLGLDFFFIIYWLSYLG